MRRELLTIGMTASILISLLAFTQPTAAVLTTVSGPDEVRHAEPLSFNATVEVREDERIPIQRFNLTFTPADSTGAVTVTFSPDGTVESVTARGDASDHVNTTLLEQSLEINPTNRNADFGYGYLSGTDERTGENRSFGYGYGYGYGDGTQPTYGFDFHLDSAAFAPGEYTVQISLQTDGDTDAFASNAKSFEVLPAQANATVDVDPDTLNKASNGKWVTAYIELADRDVADINISSVELNGVAAVDDPRYGFVADPTFKDRDEDGLAEMMVKFPRDEVADTLEPGDEVTVTVSGTVGDAVFSANDTIRVIDRGGPPDEAGSAADDDGEPADENDSANEADDEDDPNSADEDDEEADEGAKKGEGEDEDDAESTDEDDADDGPGNDTADDNGNDGRSNGDGPGDHQGNGDSNRSSDA